ncbi:MAG: efflux RND transporter periplasmic adaptor subunit [Acidobacteria bacterium]|nr:efflux RND transporter periplasmic adaptor subunit [Acidobacteriota bacterium]
MNNQSESPGSNWLKRLLNYTFLLAAVAVAIWFFLESRKETISAPDGGGPRAKTQAQAPFVRTQEVVEKEVTQTREYIGRVEAIDSVDLVARVSGYLESIHFIEGRYVKAGDLMFSIEKERFLAEIESRKGTVSQIEANLVEAEKYLRRLQSASRESVPEKDIESAQRNVELYRAQLVSAKANLDLAELDLDYATVRAPMSGRVTKKRYSVGDYVGPNSGTIVTIVQYDPIRVVCSISEVEYLNMMERSGSSPENIFRPGLRLPNGKLYPGKGRWDFADTAIDPGTGTISLRSRYSNPEGLLIPGGYVTVVMSPVKRETLPVVPQAAVNEAKEGSFVYVVGENSLAEMRFIKKRSVLGTDWIVEEGIRAGETVIVEGVQKVRPGQAVQIQNGGADATQAAEEKS